MSADTVELLLQAQPDRAVPPAVDAADRLRAGMVAQPFVGGEDDACTAIGHLTAVKSAQSALDDGIVVIVVGKRAGHGPAASLGIRVGAGVGEVQLGDGA